MALLAMEGPSRQEWVDLSLDIKPVLNVIHCSASQVIVLTPGLCLDSHVASLQIFI